MRLLTNDEIRIKRNLEVKNEIDSGMQLAKKVDELRVLKSKEEKELNDFREKTVPIVTNEIADLVARRDSLKSELDSIAAQREKLLIPLDKEWDKVNKTKEEYASRLLSLDQREMKIVSREKTLDSSLTEVQRRLESAEQSKKAQDLLASQAAQLRDEAATIKNESLSLRKEFDEYRDRAMREVNEKMAESEAKRRDMENWHVNLMKRQKEQDGRERFINDKYATLERTIKRLSNK